MDRKERAYTLDEVLQHLQELTASANYIPTSPQKNSKPCSREAFPMSQ